MKKNYYFYIGTVAELIKISPVIKELNQRHQLITVVTTGQNTINFEEFEEFTGHLKRFISVGKKPDKSSVVLFFLWTMQTFFKSLVILFKQFRKDSSRTPILIVHGDTVTCFIGALIAKILRIKLVHVESGLRSFHFMEPFPEEMCRYIVSYLADIHFCPNQWCVDNLKNRSGTKVNTFNNTLIETCLYAIKSRIKKMLVFPSNKFFILILHRQEHVVFGKESSRLLLENILNLAPKNLTCVFIMHDLAINFLHSVNLTGEKKKRKIVFLPRMPYKEFMHLLDASEMIITDGGSNQEEAYFLGKPCLLLRNFTERIEGLTSNVMLSKNNLQKIKSFLSNYQSFRKPRAKILHSPSKIIVDFMIKKI